MATAAIMPQNQAKRKTSTAGLTSGGRSVKRRASKACHCCRARKVRCDVVESGTPCTNCRLDEVECVVSDSKRRKKLYGDHDCLNQSPISSIDEADELPPFPSYEEIDGTQDLSNSFDGMAGPPPSNSLEFELSHHVPHLLCALSDARTVATRLADLVQIKPKAIA
jgi:Fungal Zn(2)-Cys(6) binuclear cluster domain